MKAWVGAGAGLVGAALVCATPASAAVATGKVTSVTRSGCAVTITAKVSQAGTYGIAVWDDKVETGLYKATTKGPGTFSVTHVFKKNVGTRATGIDIVLGVPGATKELDSRNNWDFRGSSHVLDSCKASDGKDSGEKPTAKPTKPAKPAMPVKPAKSSGPKVDTDYVAPAAHTSSLGGLEAAGGLTALLGAGYLVRRRTTKTD